MGHNVSILIIFLNNQHHNWGCCGRSEHLLIVRSGVQFLAPPVCCVCVKVFLGQGTEPEHSSGNTISYKQSNI